MNGKGCKGPVKGAKHWSSKGVAHYRDGGEVGGIAGGAGSGGSSIGGSGGNASVGGGGGNKGTGPSVKGVGVRSGTTSGTTMRNPTPKVPRGANIRPTGAPPPKAVTPKTPKPKPVGMAPKPKPTIQNPFHQGSLNKVADFIQKSRNRYGSSTGAPGSANPQGKGDLGDGIEGFSKPGMRNGGSVPYKKGR